jgi:hypothetical protein
MQSLGRQAVTLGLETLDVAWLYEEGLIDLLLVDAPTTVRQRMITRAKSFFAETVIPIRKTHRAALKPDRHVKQPAQTLHHHPRDSAAANRRLKQQGKHDTELLTESRRLLNHLRYLTRACLSAQEDDRKAVIPKTTNHVRQ